MYSVIVKVSVEFHQPSNIELTTGKLGRSAYCGCSTVCLLQPFSCEVHRFWCRQIEKYGLSSYFLKVHAVYTALLPKKIRTPKKSLILINDIL